MAKLTGTTIASTYKQLLKITSEDLGAGAGAKYIEDGEGTNSALSLSTARVGIGTDSPVNTLHVAHNIADGDNGIMIVNEQTTITDGELLGAIGFDGADGNIPSSCLEASCFIAAYAAEAHATTDKGGDLVFGCSLINENDDVVSTEHMRILDSGNVGIGNTNPSNELEVSATEQNSAVEISTFSTTATHSSQLKFRKSSHADINEGQATAAGEDLGLIQVYGYDSDDDARIAAEILFEGDAAPDGDAVPGRIKFRTAKDTDSSSPSTAMTITDDQDVGIGVVAPDSGLHVKVSATTSSYAVCHLEDVAGTVGDGDVLLWCDWSGDDEVHANARWIDLHDSDGTIGRLESSATQIDTTFTQESDIRYKENIVDTALKGLETLNKVKVRDFEWNEKYGVSKAGKKVTAGFVADELYEVYPAATKGTPGAVNDDGSIKAMGVMEGAFTRLLIKAVQELSAKVTALENA